ncbi:MAG TPA: rod shape-determining protein MreD [Flavihumibacter sp.]|jgi:hypothetical protein
MSDLVKHSLRALLFLLVQVYVLHKIPPVHQFVVPYVYYLFLIWLPFNTGRIWLMIIAFFYGLALDYFLMTPGLHAAACILVAYLRPFLVNLLIRQEGAEQSYGAPSINSMGWAPYSLLVFILTLVHHSYLVLLEWMSFGNFWYFLGKVGATTALSLVLVLLTEMLFYRKERFRTNM